MAYQATVLPVMIASPGDVSEERDVLREEIQAWNYIHSINTNVVLTPVGWETHSSPELGERPQELINTRVLADCDILVGVFWTRIGTPTGEAESGTVEEIQKHISAGKPAMIYFSSKPAHPDSINSAQLDALKEFKQRCYSEGLVEVFDNANDLRRKFSRQLQLCLNSNEYLKEILPEDGEVNVGSDGIFADPSVSLSEEALILLKTASTDPNGSILKTASFGGRWIQSGGESFGGGRGRESAKWEHALNELINNGLVVERGYKGEVFELTHEGWQYADNLK